MLFGKQATFSYLAKTRTESGTENQRCLAQRLGALIDFNI